MRTTRGDGRCRWSRRCCCCWRGICWKGRNYEAACGKVVIVIGVKFIGGYFSISSRGFALKGKGKNQSRQPSWANSRGGRRKRLRRQNTAPSNTRHDVLPIQPKCVLNLSCASLTTLLQDLIQLWIQSDSLRDTVAKSSLRSSTFPILQGLLYFDT